MPKTNFKLTEEEQKVFTVPENLTVSEWADKYRILDIRNSREPGHWHTNRVAYLKEIMDAFNNDDVSEIVICSGAQNGKTESILNMMGYAIHLRPGPILIVYPTQDIADSVSRNRIKTAINSSDALTNLKTNNAYDFQIEEMRLLNSTIYVAWSNSPAVLASKPIRYLFLDEVDKYKAFSGKEADPISLAKDRTASYSGYSKVVMASTPTFEDGNIWRYLRICSVVYEYFIPCPHCGKYQTLKWDNVKWDKNADFESVRTTAYYECEHCHKPITEAEKVDALRSGKWRIVREKSKSKYRVGFHISSLYSPVLTLGDLATEFLEAKKDPVLMMNFINSRLAMPYKQITEKQTADNIISHKTKVNEGELPDNLVALCAGVDTQDNGFFYTIYAFALENKKYIPYLVRNGFVETFSMLDKILFEDKYILYNNVNIPISRGLIYSGGHRTSDVYDYAREHRGIIFPCKGMAKASGINLKDSNLEKYPNSNKYIEGGLRLVNVNTEFYKDNLNTRLLSNDGIYFHSNIDDNFVSQMMAEESDAQEKATHILING